MKFEDRVQTEYDRWKKAIGDDDPHTERNCIGVHDVLKAHFIIANYFYLEGEGLGGIGPKSLNLLHSAVGRQHTSLGATFKWNTPFEICATLMFGLIRDHPFHDANKRTALLSGLYFLKMRSIVPTTDKKTLENMMVEIAERKFDARRFEELKSNHHVDDATVMYVAKFLSKNSRKTDHKEYLVTYRELNAILARYNFRLDDPDRNYINLYRIEKKRRLLSRQEFEEKKFILQIGFPGWGREVHQSAVKSVRVAAGLTADRGIDSRAFYRGVDDLDFLLAEYHANLRSLADR